MSSCLVCKQRNITPFAKNETIRYLQFLQEIIIRFQKLEYLFFFCIITRNLLIHMFTGSSICSVPTIVTGDNAKYGTDIFQKEAASGSEQKLVFSKFDAAELDNLFIPGNFVDAFLSLDSYDYQQSAGIRLVADKLVIHSN